MRRPPLAVVLFVAITLVTTAGSTSEQGPGSSWKVVATPEGAVKTLYWELFDRTEIWTRIVPHASDPAGAAPPISLIFSATFKGKVLSSAEIRQPPAEVVVLAQPGDRAVLPVPNWSFAFTTSTGETIDLVKAGLASRLLPCPGCYEDAITAKLDAKLFAALAASDTASCHVLGFACVLDRADTTALMKFARHIKLIDE